MYLIVSFAYFTASFFLLVLSQQITYKPPDNPSCSTQQEYTLFIDTNVTFDIQLQDTTTDHNVVFQYGGGSPEDLTYTPPQLTITRYLDTVGTFDFVITTAEGTWQKSVRVVDTPTQILDASVTYTSLMSGESFQGEVKNISIGNTYKWYARKKENGAPYWKLIAEGVSVFHQFQEEPGLYELMVASPGSYSPCRRVWLITIYIGQTEIYIARPAIPEIGEQQLVKVTVHNNTQVGDVLWKYDENNVMPGCTTRSRVVKSQSFVCRFVVDSYFKSLKVELKPDDGNQTWHSVTIDPVTTFSLHPLYVQKGSDTTMNINADGSNRYHRWLDMKRSGGIEQDSTSWSSNYLFSNNVGSDVIVSEAYNAISYVKKNTLVQIVDAYDFSVLNHYTNVLFGEETVIPFGVTVLFTIESKMSYINYTWTIPVLQRASLVTPTSSFGRTVITDMAVLATADPWRFDFGITPYLDGGPNFTARTFTVHVYQPISLVRVVPEDVRGALVVGTGYGFNLTWDGSEGHCAVIELNSTSRGIGMVEFTVTNTDGNFCFFNMQAPLVPLTDLILRIKVENRLNHVNKTWTFKVYNFIEHLNITYYEQLARGVTYEFAVVNATSDTLYRWYLRNDQTYSTIAIGEGEAVSYTVPDTFRFGYYQVMVNATGSLFEAGHISTQYESKVVGAQLSPNISPDVLLNVTSNSSLQLWVAHIIDNATYSWSIYNPFSDGWSSVGSGAFTNYSDLAFFDEGTYTISVKAQGVWVLDGGQSENVTFEVCRPLAPLVTSGSSRSLLISQPLFASVSITTRCITKHEWSFRCINPSDSNCAGGGGSVYQPILLPRMNLTTNAPVLELPARAFKEGDYLIENRVLIREQSVYNISIELSVRPSELIPLISGGEARQVGVNNDVTLDAAQSIDPDVAQLSPATLFRYVLINFGSHYIIMKL